MPKFRLDFIVEMTVYHQLHRLMFYTVFLLKFLAIFLKAHQTPAFFGMSNTSRKLRLTPLNSLSINIVLGYFPLLIYIVSFDKHLSVNSVSRDIYLCTKKVLE